MSAAELLAKLRATPLGYRRNELFEQIEKTFGRGFAKSLREQMREEAPAERRPQPKRRR